GLELAAEIWLRRVLELHVLHVRHGARSVTLTGAGHPRLDTHQLIVRGLKVELAVRGRLDVRNRRGDLVDRRRSLGRVLYGRALLLHDAQRRETARHLVAVGEGPSDRLGLAE